VTEMVRIGVYSSLADFLLNLDWIAVVKSASLRQLPTFSCTEAASLHECIVNSIKLHK